MYNNDENEQLILSIHMGHIVINYHFIWGGGASIIIVDPSCFSSILSPTSSQPRWLSGLRRSHVHSLMIARRSLCPEKLGSNPGQGSKGINFSGWHGLDMSITVTKRR